MPPLRDIPDVAQQQVGDEACPDLPPDRVLAVADEVVDLAGLLQLPEERLDAPPGPVQLGYRLGGELEVVREERDLHDDNRLDSSIVMWRLAAAFCHLCLAQSKQLSVSLIVHGASRNTLSLLRRER